MIKFGTGGWRAIIGDEFTKANLQLVCQALSQMLDETGIVLGYDRRFLSNTAAIWAAEVFAGNGKKVYFIDKVSPTPLIMFTVEKEKISYGMAITASHNPAAYNGVKIFTKGGRDAGADVTEKIEEIISNTEKINAISFDEGIDKGIIKIITPMNDYVDSVLEKIDVGKIRQANLHVAIDPMFGVSRTALLAVLISARCDVFVINDRHDTLFGGRLPAPEAATLHKLRDVVTENNYDMGIATDGDADRIGIIGPDGSYVHPNMLLAILYYYFLQYKKQSGAVVRNIATTHLLDRIAEDFNQKAYEVPVGFKFISSKMEEVDALIGGESSGGLTIRDHIHGKDGIFAAALLVEMLAVSEKRLEEFIGEIEDRYGQFHWVESSHSFSRKLKEELTDKLMVQKLLPDFGEKIESVSYVDGVKVCFENGDWVSARFSGTEPLIRVFSESTSIKRGEEYAEDFKKLLNLS